MVDLIRGKDKSSRELRRCNVKAKPGLLLLLLLVACAPGTASFETSAEPVAGTNPEPTEALTPGDVDDVTPSVGAADASLTWNAESETVVLRLEETGGMLQPAWGTEIPLWTLYGDGLVVWTQDGPPTPGFTQQVWTGHLDEAGIKELLSFAREIGFFDLDAEYKAPRFVPAETDESAGAAMAPNLEGAPDQETGLITIDLLAGQHRVQVYPAAWAEAPEAYRALREQIMSTRPGDAAPFVPTTLLLSATPVSPEAAPASPEWPLANIVLADATATPLQLDAAQGTAVAEFLTTQGVFATELGLPYRLNLWGVPPQSP
jgi:hypothetical protein